MPLVPRPFLSRPSLRARLVVATTAACVLAFVAAGVILYVSMSNSLYRQFDDALVARATALTALVEFEGPRIHLQRDPVLLAPYSETQRRNYYEIRAEDGSLIDHSPSLGDARLAPDLLPGPVGRSEARADVTLPDGRRARVAALAFIPRADEEHPDPPARSARRPITVLVATETRRVDDNLFRFAKQLIFACGGATIATAAALWWLISRQLRPVHAVAEQIARVGRADLAERLDPGEVPTELLPVVGRLNELLARLSDAFDREKAFTADVAHELRTPISALETALEISGSRVREPDAYRQTLGHCLRTVRDMHNLVDRLLTLARADAHQLKVRPEPLDVRALIQDAWDVVQTRADKRQLSLDLDVPDGSASPAGRLTTDRELLRLVVQNALDNAVSYAPPGSTLRVRLDAGPARRHPPPGADDDGAAAAPPGPTLHFLNPAPDLTAEQVARVFDRFWRADHARPTGGHAGLGLPLCQRLMQALHGSATVSLDPPALFHLALRFPGGPRPTP